MERQVSGITRGGFVMVINNIFKILQDGDYRYLDLEKKEELEKKLKNGSILVEKIEIPKKYYDIPLEKIDLNKGTGRVHSPFHFTVIRNFIKNNFNIINESLFDFEIKNKVPDLVFNTKTGLILVEVGSCDFEKPK